MYFYHHLGRGTKQFVENPSGLPVIYQEQVIIPLIPGTNEHDITDAVRLLTQYHAVGLWVVEPSASGVQKLTEKLTCASRAVFDTAYLTLKDNTATLFKNLSLRLIEKANANGMPFYVAQKGFINLTESKLNVWSASIGTDTAIVLMIDYVIPAGKDQADRALINK